MKLLLLSALCAIALARIPSSSWERDHYPEYEVKENAFRSGKEYTFKYDGQLASGIPGTSRQHSATRIQALVSVFFKESETCVLKIQKVRIGKLNERISCPRSMIPFMAFEEVEITNELEQKLLVPLKFNYRQGMISEVVFDGKEESWSANIKRGILNMLQVNLKKHGITSKTELARMESSPKKTLIPELDYFTVMEPTLEGLCETLYTVTSQPSYYTTGPILNVTKSIDFEKCQKRPEIKYNWRFQDPCPTCEPKYSESQKFLKASTLAKYNISGTPENFVIESAIVESQYNFVPFNREGNMMSTYINQTLVLIYSGEPRERIAEPRNVQKSDSDMIFTPEWDIAKEEMFMSGEEEFLRETPYSELKNKVEFVKRILRRLISEMGESIEEEAPRQYLRLVKIFRMLKLSQIKEIHETLYKNADSFTPEQHKKIREILFDALADAGTKDTISHMVWSIKQKEISPLRASITIKQLINTRVVSKEMIEELLSLAENPVCERNWFLKQSVYLTLGSMVNALCTPNQDKIASEFKVRPQQFCPREYKQELVEKMFSKYNNAKNFGDKVVYLKTIANMGLEESVIELEKIIKGVEREPVPLRVEAILALRQIRHTIPRKVQQILMPIFMNRQMPTELRITAAYQIFQTLPERPVLDQMARKLFTERNRQVASFVFSQMITLANSTNPCQKKLAQDLQLSLRHGRHISYAFYPSYSKLIAKDIYSRKYRMGLEFVFGSVMTPKNRFPTVLAGGIHANLLGMWNKYLLSFGVVASDMDSLLHKYLSPKGLWNEMDLEDILVRAPRSAKTSSPQFELKQLWQKLKTVQRSLPNNPEGFFYLRYKDQDFGIIPFNLQTMSETFNDFISEGRINLKEIERFLESGYNFHIYKAAIVHEMSYKIPTTLGMPLVLSIKVPTVMQLTGQVKAEIRNRWQKIGVELVNTKPSMVSAIVADIQCWSPITNSGLKVVGLSKIFVPIDGEIRMDLTTSPATLVAKYELPKEAVQWIHLETRPVTYTRVWPKFLESWQEPEEKTIHGEEWTRMYNFEKDFPVVRKFEEFCEQSLGLKVFTRGFWHHTPSMRLQNTPFCPLSGVNKLYIRTQPTSDMPRVVVTKMTGSIFSPISSPLKFSSKMEKEFFEEEEESMETEWDKFAPKEHHESFIKVEVKTEGGKKLQAELEARARCDPELRLCKYSAEYERSPVPEYDSEPFKMCLESEYLLPKSPYYLKELSGKKIVGSLKTTWGRNCNNRNFVKVNVLAQRSQEQKKLMESEPEFEFFSSEKCESRPELCSPVSAYPTLSKAARLNSYKLEAEWENVSPIVKNMTSKLYRAIKTYLYWNSEVNNVEINHPNNRLSVRLTLDPRTLQHVNVTVKTPKEKAIFRDIPLRFPVRPLNLKRTSLRSSSLVEFYEMITSQVAPVCHVGSGRIQTFDEVEYSSPITTCWSVLAKDCREENFAVLMKKINSESHEKKIKIITPSHKIVLEHSSRNHVKVLVNEEEITLEESEPTMLRHHGHLVCKIEKTGPYVKVVLPEQGVRVYFDGYACNIKMSPMLKNSQCGLCGHYDDEIESEFRNPEYEEEQDVRSFIQKWMVKEPKCEYPEELERICSEPECRYQTPYKFSWEQDWESQEETSQEESREWSERIQTRPVRRTQVIERNSKICFSKQPVLVCPHNTYPKEFHKTEKKVQYACLPRDDIEVDSLLRRIRVYKEVPSRVSTLPTAFTETETQPQSCLKY